MLALLSCLASGSWSESGTWVWDVVKDIDGCNFKKGNKKIMWFISKQLDVGGSYSIGDLKQGHEQFSSECCPQSSDSEYCWMLPSLSILLDFYAILGKI